MRYLITGLPRIRSAWLAAVLGSNERPCYHDALVKFKNVDGLRHHFETSNDGWSDPTAGCYLTDLAIELYSDKPVVIIDRDEASAFDNFSKYMQQSGMQLEQRSWMQLALNLSRFRRAMPHALVVDFAKLDEYETVATIYWHCTGEVLSRDRFDIFNLLDVQEMASKALRDF